MSYDNIRNRGAIICKHISYPEHPMLHASRGEPIVPEDSGWQFHCGAIDHSEEDAALWRLAEVVQIEPSGRPILDAECGAAFERADVTGTWRITDRGIA